MVSAKRTLTRPRSSKLKNNDADKNRKFRQRLAKMFRSRKFTIVVLVIAVLDTLLVASELVNDILAVIKEESELCDTENILNYLNASHPGQLDKYFRDYNAEEILEQLQGGQQYMLRLHKREIKSVTAPSFSRPSEGIRLSTTSIPMRPSEGIGVSMPQTSQRPSEGIRLSTTSIPLRPSEGIGVSTSQTSQSQSDSGELSTTTIPLEPSEGIEVSTERASRRPTDNIRPSTTSSPFRPRVSTTTISGRSSDSTTVSDTTVPSRPTDKNRSSTTPNIPRSSIATKQTVTSPSPRPPVTDNGDDSTTPARQGTTSIPQHTTTDFLLIHPSEYNSSALFQYAFICGSWSSGVLTLVCLMKIVQITVQGKGFLLSKLQVIDAVVVMIFLPTDFSFLPARFASASIVSRTLPMLFDVVSRVIRVIISSLVVLQAQDREMLTLKHEEFKTATKRYRCFKGHIRNLQELARAKGAEESQLVACKEIVYNRKRRASYTANGVLSLNRLLFLAAPLSYPNKNQHMIDEEEKEEKVDWVHPRTISLDNAKESHLDANDNTAANAEEPTPRSSGSYESEDEEEEMTEDPTDYSTLDAEELGHDLAADEDYITTHL